MSLRTARLELRPATDGDRPAIIAMATDPDVRRHLGGPLSASDAEAAVAGPRGRVWGSFLVAVEGDVVGGVSFDSERGELEVSYSLLPSHWGRGLAAEAVGAALDWVAAATGEDRVILVTQLANVASVRLAQRLGFAERERFVEFGAEQVLMERGLAQPPGRTAPA